MATRVPEKMVGSEEKGRRRELGLDGAPPTVWAAFRWLGAASASGFLSPGGLPSSPKLIFPGSHGSVLRSVLFWSTETTSAAGRPYGPSFTCLPGAGQGPPALPQRLPHLPVEGDRAWRHPRGSGAERRPLLQTRISSLPGSPRPSGGSILRDYRSYHLGLLLSCLSTPIPPTPPPIYFSCPASCHIHTETRDQAWWKARCGSFYCSASKTRKSSGLPCVRGTGAESASGGGDGGGAASSGRPAAGGGFPALRDPPRATASDSCAPSRQSASASRSRSGLVRPARVAQRAAHPRRALFLPVGLEDLKGFPELEVRRSCLGRGVPMSMVLFRVRAHCARSD